MLNERQRFGSMASAIVLLSLACAFSARLPRIGSAAVLVTAFILICLNLSPESRRKPSLRYAAGMFLACLLLLDSQIQFSQILGAMAKFWPVVCLLLGISLFRHSLMRSGLGDLISRPLLSQPEGFQNGMKVALAATGLGVFASMGAISIMCTALSAKVRNRLALSSNVVRALCSSMYVLPTTATAATVATAIPHLNAGEAAWLGIPLMVLMLLGAMNPRLEPATTAAPDSPAPTRKAPWILAFLVAAAGAAAMLLTRQVTLSIAIAMLLGYGADIVFLSKRRTSRTVLAEVARSVDAIAPEMLLFAGSGLMILTMQRLDIPSQMPPWLVRMVFDQNFALLALLVVFPLITVAGVHPLVLFGVFFPLIHAPIFNQPALHYLAWTSVFVLSNLLSPASVCSIVAAASLQCKSRETSYQSNWQFCIALVIFTFAYLSWLAARY